MEIKRYNRGDRLLAHQWRSKLHEELCVSAFVPDKFPLSRGGLSQGFGGAGKFPLSRGGLSEGFGGAGKFPFSREGLSESVS